MNPVNATALYVSASRAVLQCDPRQPHTMAEMYKLLPFFRQSLSCLVCGKLLQEPTSTAHPECHHYVCLGCKGQKMRVRLSCTRCKDYSGFLENKQLSLLVQCYKKLCLYVIHSPLLQAVSSHAAGSPDVLTLLEEVLTSQEEEEEEEGEGWSSVQGDVNPSPTEAPPSPTELSATPQTQSVSSDPHCSNGPQECNGDVLEDLDPSSPELEVCELIEERPQPGLSVSDGLELSLTTGPLAPPPGAMCSLRGGVSSTTRELDEGEVLLLSVEEVLQTLDPLQPGRDPAHTHTHSHTDRTHTQMFIHLDSAHNYTQIQTGRSSTATTGHGVHIHTTTCSLEPGPTSKPPSVRPNRKRSHSESDREKVKPLPISSILQSSNTHSHTLSHTSHTHTHSQTPPQSTPAHTYSSLSNGTLSKPSRPTQNYSKGGRKQVEPGPKKPHSKARSGGSSKNKDRSKEQRLVSGCLVPPAPVRPPYKKPIEKKGCKCGRATQNPSVLTCRGQRCPCYSNRKACLDCICRGCQNSYMANGEKKLEAFAVPEKALEQTRLTLGINLTSITAAAALRNPATTSIRGNTLLNVATATGTPVTTAFLSPSPPPDPSYEDSLELLIG
ncbi:E3 ubiquitin-protein ligase MSL2a [Gouania willdenowi]|uniref:E3 ubiquitin-protein ligase MSL2 n=1 Tax=Gouania willdenowi TaxID=441366 RepID=A0A8C5HBY2_GOUWI|nr:E3 ubiquitin-protein ligase MSL2 [Gouania willdenowi]